MRFAIYGTGAVGGYYGARLADAGEDVVFIARGDNLQALKTQGLRLDSALGNLHLQVHATDDPTEVGIVDVIIPCVKTYHIPEIAPLMRPMVGPDTMIVTTQNGVDAPDEFGKVLGMEHVLGGAVRVFVILKEPGYIYHGGETCSFVFGEFNHQRTPRSLRLLEVMQRTPGIEPELTTDIEAELWKKEMMIGSFGSMGAITRAPMGIYRSIPESRAMLIACMREIKQVAEAIGISLPNDIVDKTLAFGDAQPAHTTSSLQRDIIAGRKSEMESLIGAVVRMGHAAGLEVPVLSAIYAALLPTEMRARGKLEFES